MNKYLKYALLAVAGIGVLLAGLITFVAATFDPNSYKPQIIALVKEQKQRDLSLAGSIALSFYPNLGVNISKLSLGEHKSNKEFIAIESARVSLALMPLLKKEVVVNEVVIKGLNATVIKYKNGSLNIDDLLNMDAEKSAPSEQFKLDIRHVLLENAALTYRDEQKNTQHRVEGIQLKTGRIANNIPSQIELALHVKADQPKLNLAVKMGGELTANTETQQFNFAKLSVKFNVESTNLPNKTIGGEFTGNAAIDAKKQSAAINLAGKLIDSNVKASFNLAGFAPPAMRFDVDIDELDLDKLLPPKTAATETSPATSASTDTPLDFSALKAFNASGSLRIGTLKIANIKSSKVRLEIKANNGKLDVNPLAANLYEGTVNGSLAVNAHDNSVSVRQNLSGINIAPLLKDAVNKDMLEGRGSVNLDVRAQGKSVVAMKKSLGGNAALNLADGAIKGINLAESIRKAKAKLGAAKGQEMQAANKAEKTDFSELKASFTIKNGVAHNQDLSMKSPLLRLSGEGDINLGEDRLDYLAKTTLVATAAGQGGKEAAELKGITIPVRVSGPYTAISYKLDFGGAVSEVAKQKVETKKEEIKTKLGDKLKGLFR